MKSVVIFGARGMLGYAVCAYFARSGYSVSAIGRADYDIARDAPSTIEGIIKGGGAVINCAGVIKPRILEMPIEDVLRVNAIFPRNLAQCCAAHEIPCFHVTTDCVYSGSKGDYAERDYVDAEDVYGLSKAGGDGAPCMVLRTSIIGEEQGQRRSLLEWARGEAGKAVNGFVNHRWNGVTTLHLAETMRAILENNLYACGVYHLFSPEPVTKFELLQLIDQAYGLGLTIAATEAGQACDRTLTSTHGLSAQLCTKPLLQQLCEMKAFFASEREPHA